MKAEARAREKSGDQMMELESRDDVGGTSVRVVEYGCLPPVNGGELIEHQLRLAHRYKNKLVEIELEGRNAYRVAAREFGDMDALMTEIEEIEGELEKTLEAIKKERQESRGRSVGGEHRERAKEIRSRLRDKRADLKALRSKLKNHPAMKSRTQEINEERRKAIREARGNSGVYWGTYLRIENAARKAASGKMDPRFQRYTGEGCLSVQFQKGLDVEKVFSGNRKASILPVSDAAWNGSTRGERRKASRSTLEFCVFSDERKPVFAELPVIVHRPLPEGGKVKWALLKRRRVADKWKWSVQFVVESPDKSCQRWPQKKRSGTATLEFSWKATAKGLLVCRLADDSGRKEELVLARRGKGTALGRLEHAHSIQGIRDRNLEEIKEKIKGWDGPAPEWFREMTKHHTRWRSPAKLVALCRFWRDQRFDGDSGLFEAVESWIQQDRHLWQWERNEADGAIRQRREMYRCFAAKLAKRYACVVLEKIDLRVSAKRRPVDLIHPEMRARIAEGSSRPLRFQAAISELRESIINACKREGVEVRLERNSSVAVPAADGKALEALV